MINPYRELSQVNPQRDNGHRRINTDIWRALTLVDITASAYKVIMCVIDRSWGYDQLEATIGYSVFMKATGLTKVSIRNGVKDAVNKRLLIVEPGNYRDASKYLFNKHYDTWVSITGIDINTGKATIGRPGIPNDTTPGIPPTSKLSYSTENIIKNKKRYISSGINKKNNTEDQGGPNTDKFTRGKFGHMVARTGEDMERLHPEKAKRIKSMKGIPECQV